MNPMRPNITAMAAYVPGFQPPESERFIKLNTNENPFSPSPKVIAAILEEAGAGLRKYPDSKSLAPRLEASRVYGFDPDWIIMANGSDEVLNNLIRCFAAEGEEIGYVHPSYSYYLTLAQIQGAQVRPFPLSSELELQERVTDFKGKIFFLANPNAPFGFSFPLYFIDDLASRLEGILVVDEAYVDFCDENSLELVRRHDNLVVTRTLSKSYSLAGMRIGLAIGPPPIIAALDKIRDHYNLDRLAQVAAVAALKDQDYFHSCVAQIRVTREWFRAGLLDLGYEALPSQANFIFCSPPDRNGQRVYQGLYDRRILVRHFSDPFLAHGLRISIGGRQEMEATLAALREIG